MSPFRMVGAAESKIDPTGLPGRWGFFMRGNRGTGNRELELSRFHARFSVTRFLHARYNASGNIHCRHGRPDMGRFLALALLCVFASIGRADDAPELRAVIDKAVKTHGGADKLAAIKA